LDIFRLPCKLMLTRARDCRSIRKDGPSMRYLVAACLFTALASSALFLGGWGPIGP
jgi:hypothetical protein